MDHDHVPTTARFEIVEVPPQQCAVIRSRATMAEVPELFTRGVPAIAAAVAAQHVTAIGPPFGVYPTSPEGIFEVVVGLPISVAITPAGDVEPWPRPGGRVAVALHIGPFDSVGPTYAAMAGWLQSRHQRPGPIVWEEYLSDPATEPDPAGWRTRIIWPLAD